MGIFDKLGTKIGETAKNAKELVDAAKINSTIESTKASIRAHYAELGEKFYLKFGKSADMDPEFKTICDEIVKFEEQIEELKVQYLIAKNVWMCPKCSVEVEREQAFCSKCGSPQPPVAPPA
jgi:Zn finger protein HypA/HybF involved in hydrogenase expression